MNMFSFLIVSRTCDKTLPWVRHQLLQAGLRSIQTFDLTIARAASHGCECPHHGTHECDCQLVVLLVYGKSEEPVTLTLHGNDGMTWLSITSSVQSDHAVGEQIRQALEFPETASDAGIS